MSQQTIKQRARRKAHDAVARQRKERAERERRIEELAVQVLTAVEEREAAVAETERRAGAALRLMTEAEGLTLREAVDWCGEQISVREATRLRRLDQVIDEMANSRDLRPAAAKPAEKMEREAAGDTDGESAATAAG